MTRFGQLLYASFDDPAGGQAGGWQVRAASADLSADERETALAHVVVQFPPDVAFSQFPSADEIAARPTRLSYARSGVGGVLTHAVPAGDDATGRPNNVFSHVVLDRRPGSTDGGHAMRPIELWQWEGWLTPFGAAEVRAAALPHVPPEPAGVVDRGSVVDFLFEPGSYRFGRLAQLLDAVNAATGPEGLPVVGVVDTPGDGAWWIGAVSFFLSPQAAAGLTFSTRLRPADLQTGNPPAARLNMLLLDIGQAVPADRGQVVLIDLRPEADGHDVSEGTSWRTAGGALVPHSAFGRLALDACAEGLEPLQAILDGIDEVTPAEPAERVALPWHLAMAMAGTTGASLAHVAGLRHLLSDDAALRLIDRAWLGQLEAALDEALGESPDEAWELVGGLRPTDRRFAPVAEQAVVAYLSRAVDDPDWLAAGADVALPPPYLVGHVRQDRQDVQAAISLKPLFIAEPGALGPATIGLLLIALYIDDARQRASPAVLELTERVARAVADPAVGPTLTKGRAWPEMLAVPVAMYVERLLVDPGPGGEVRLWPGLTTVLGGWADDSALAAQLQRVKQPGLLLGQILIERAEAGAIQFRPTALAALWRIGAADTTPPAVWVEDALVRLGGGGGWSSTELVTAIREVGTPMPAGLIAGLLPWLLTSGPTEPEARIPVAAAVDDALNGDRWSVSTSDHLLARLLSQEPTAWRRSAAERDQQIVAFLTTADQLAQERDTRAWPLVAPSVIAARALVEVAHGGSYMERVRMDLNRISNRLTGDAALRSLGAAMTKDWVQQAVDIVLQAAEADAMGDIFDGFRFETVRYIGLGLRQAGVYPFCAVGVGTGSDDGFLGEIVTTAALQRVAGRKERQRLVDEAVERVGFGLRLGDIPDGETNLHKWASSLLGTKPRWRS